MLDQQAVVSSGRSPGSPLDRQVDPEAGPGTHGALDLDVAAVFGNNPVADAEAQARTTTNRLGREERIEDPRQHVGRDATAIVGDLDNNLALRCERGQSD